MVDGFQHAQSQQVEFHQAHGGAIVLIPLHHAAVFHARPFGGHHLGDGSIADHHAAGVDAQVARLPFELPGHGTHQLRGLLGATCPGIHLARRVSQRAGGIAQRTFAAVGDHIGHLSCVIPPIAGIDVLDGLFPAPGFDVHIDIRRAIALRREEAFKQQPGRHGIHVGDAQGKTHRGVGCGAAPLAQDVRGMAEADDVMDDQKIARESQLFYGQQLSIDGCPCPRGSGRGLIHPLLFLRPCFFRSRSVAHRGTARGDFPQPGHLRVPLRHGEMRQLRRNEVEGERAFPRHLHRGGHGIAQPLVIPRQPQHLRAAAHPCPAQGVRDGLCGAHIFALMQRAFHPGQPRPLRIRARGRGAHDFPQPVFHGQGVQLIIVIHVHGLHGVHQLYHAIFRPERAY